MIVRYTVSNFRSLKNEVELDFVSTSKIREKKDHEVKLGRLSIVKNIGLFGANASGKSNLIKSLSFLQAFIKTEFDPADFAFKGNEKMPTKFDIVFKTDSSFYQYTLSIIRASLFEQVRVVEESLYQLKLNGDNVLLFSSDSLIPDAYKGVNQDYEAYVRGYAQASNRPFLSYITSSERQTNGFELWEKINDAFLFFANSLLFVGEDVPSAPLTDDNLRIIETELLSYDTGLSGVEFSDIRPEEAQAILLQNAGIRRFVNQALTVPGNVLAINNSGVDLLRFTNTDSSINAQRLVFKHKNIEGSFLLGEESDGTKRLFFMLADLLCIKGDNNTIVVDEIDRSAHPFLPERLIEDFQRRNSDNHMQLIFSSHQNELMNTVLRRDEIYFFNKDQDGVTSITSLMDFKSRTSDNIAKLYIEGRFGGIPRMGYRISKEVLNGPDKFGDHKA